ncbi:MAG TPA: M1 family metallopeptidase [Cyclobacteriaceae bacterium]|nr:M1 family metallopeptidase [Cyclobacteriaceae bacterium]
MKIRFTLLTILVINSIVFAQDYRWQQRVEYAMNIQLDTKTHRIAGDQQLIYHNNSNDTLTKVYYHLYFNAFQPGSMMDVRSRNLPDPDPRVMDRISKLSNSEIGYHRIISLNQDGTETKFRVTGTLLEVNLPRPIYPHSKTTLVMKFESQVPIQIRRSGRDNKEGIAYSMTQWYPKIAEYDFKGWHAYPYIAREFHGVWGDFDVKITINPDFTVAGSGILQNANEIGHGYEDKGVSVKKSKTDLTWHFVAKNVHDFAWTADPDYRHTKVQVPNGPLLHFFFQPGEKTTDNWTKLMDYGVKHFQFMNDRYGKYPYETYSIIQGGDGGMEYPMCTLITGERSLGSLVGVMAHEAAHAWFQGVLGNNEALYPWMDEGFTDFASNESVGILFNEPDPQQSAYQAYFLLVKKGLQEPLGQHSDHYNTNTAYGISAYSMGAMFLNQLKYLVGDNVFYPAMRKYFNTWKFKHPEPNDFLRVFEKESGLQLHWFYRDWILSTKHIDYGIEKIESKGDQTQIELKRIGDMAMPIELVLELKDGTKRGVYLPMNELLGQKNFKGDSLNWTIEKTWNWVEPTYSFTVDQQKSDIVKVTLDPKRYLPDLDYTNNEMIIR